MWSQAKCITHIAVLGLLSKYIVMYYGRKTRKASAINSEYRAIFLLFCCDIATIIKIKLKNCFKLICYYFMFRA